MKDGFIKAAAGTPEITVGDPEKNRETCERVIAEMAGAGAKLMVLPELCLTGYECRDLFGQPILERKAREQLMVLAEHTKDVDALIFVGLPLEFSGKLYNCAAALGGGRVLGIIPKTNLPNYDEFYEYRNFAPAGDAVGVVTLVKPDGGEYSVPFGTGILFQAKSMPHLIVGCEICEDLWVPNPPSNEAALHGATVIVNLSASDELVGKDAYRRMLVASHSGSLVAGYIYASAGYGESSTDLVFGAQNMIAENGSILAEAKLFSNKIVTADLDVDRLVTERRRMTSYPSQNGDGRDYEVVPFDLAFTETKLNRIFDPHPFVPSSKAERDMRCDEILNIQALGLKKRLQHTNCRSAVIGISGGLDSTLALLVTVRAFDMLNIPRKQILSVTMPCFGTTDRTYHNACVLTEKLGASLKEVNIRKAVMQHFEDIGHDPENHDVTYENSQARERTQILMDLANQSGGLVIGTGDLSELALGWATYNGDHMSMYAVNCSVPKTLVRHLVRYYADTCGDAELEHVLQDILDTPVSPELLPPTGDGTIAQKTEDLVGPYELHDFFLYYMVRLGFPPSKIFRIALATFDVPETEREAAFDETIGDRYYDRATILKWLKTFYRRFFSQQFKRSCLPDGPKVGSVSFSPRGNLRMPSDASVRLWLSDLEKVGGQKEQPAENKL